MDSGDTDIEKSHDIEQRAIIGKIHSMQWLKSNSQLSGYTKTLPGEKEVKSNPLKSKINEGTKESDTVLPTDSVLNSTKIENIDLIPTVNTDESDNILRKKIESSLAVVEPSQEDMATVWDKDVGSLFPNTQSLVMQRLDEDEMMSMALAESLVTAQLEQLRFNNDGTSKPDKSHDELGDDWSTVDANLPDSSKSDNDVDNQVDSKQCHDNNNNNAKSKTPSAPDVKKGIQKTTTKVSTRKSIEPKTKKLTGSILKVSNNTPKQGSKDKDDSANLNNNDNDKPSTSTTDVKRSSVTGTSKYVDRHGRVDIYSNRYLYLGKGARTKEQQYSRQHVPSHYDSNKSSSSMEGLDDKSKLVSPKVKSSKAESEKKLGEGDDTKKCHRVQVTRTQSFNLQYNRSKPLIKPQQRYSKGVTKLEQETCGSKQYTTSGSSTNVSTSSASVDTEVKKVSENGQTKISKTTNGQCIEQEPIKGNETKGSFRSTSYVAYKGTLHPSRFSTEKKDEQGYLPKFKRDSNVFRRSSDYTESKYLSTRPKIDDHKKTVIDSNTPRDYRLNRPCAINEKLRSQPDSARTSLNSPKVVTGANKMHKTDTAGSSTINNVQHAKSLSSSNGTKVVAASAVVVTHKQQESEPPQATFNGTEVQSVKKTEQDENINNSSNHKVSVTNVETKSVKFSDNVQEYNVTNHTVYPNNSVQQGQVSKNPFYTDTQSVSHVNIMQHVESQQNAQNKNYFYNVAQYNDPSVVVQSSERELQYLDVHQQKPEQAVHVSSQNITSQTPNSSVVTGTAMNYQNISGMYLNQYNNAQTMPRKSDCTGVTQNTPIVTNSSYNVENQNLLQNEPPSIMMHNNQAPVLPPPGFHNHSIATQPNQWNIPVPEVLCFGNMMSPGHPMNIPIQNSRHVCNTDFNNMQQTGYLQQPLFYMPPICVQGWNPLLQYPTPLYQNPQYGNCNTFPNQVMPSNNLNEPINCSVPSSTPNNPYKHFQQVQQVENNPIYSAPIKLENYTVNVHGPKSSSGRMKENVIDGQFRSGQYRSSNEYLNCSQDGQVIYRCIVPRNNNQSNVHMQMNQKYQTPRAISGGNYQEMLENAMFHNNQDTNRKDESTYDLDCIPPIVSPRESMFCGVNYSRKTDNVPNSYQRSEIKPMNYNMYSGSSQHSAQQFHRNSNYHASSKESTSSRVSTFGRGMRKMMEQ